MPTGYQFPELPVVQAVVETTPDATSIFHGMRSHSQQKTIVNQPRSGSLYSVVLQPKSLNSF